MINDGLSLRDYFQNHPEIEVDKEFLDQACGPARYEKVALEISVENPIIIGKKPDWKATAQHIQDQLTSVAMNAAETLNFLGTRLPALQLALQQERTRTDLYKDLLKNPGKIMTYVEDAISLKEKPHSVRRAKRS